MFEVTTTHYLVLSFLLFAIGVEEVERPGLTINDRYWELVLTEVG